MWESAVYSGTKVKEISESYWWTTRVPDTLSEAKELIVNSDKEKMRSKNEGTAIPHHLLFHAKFKILKCGI